KDGAHGSFRRVGLAAFCRKGGLEGWSASDQQEQENGSEPPAPWLHRASLAAGGAEGCRSRMMRAISRASAVLCASISARASARVAEVSSLGGSDGFVRPAGRPPNLGGTLLKHGPPRGFLLGVDLRAGLLERLLPGANLFLRRGPVSLRFAPGTLAARPALVEHALHGAAATRSQKQVEKEDHQDGRDSLPEQLAKLSENLHGSFAGKILAARPGGGAGITGVPCSSAAFSGR